MFLYFDKINTDLSPWTGIQATSEQGLKFQWYDGRRLTYDNWSPGKPERDTGKKCVKMWYYSYPENSYWNLGEWDNNGCSEKRAYICSKPADPAIPIGNSFYNPYGCPAGWIPHESSCFKV